jgi:hypothetical protein
MSFDKKHHRAESDELKVIAPSNLIQFKLFRHREFPPGPLGSSITTHEKQREKFQSP